MILLSELKLYFDSYISTNDFFKQKCFAAGPTENIKKEIS